MTKCTYNKAFWSFFLVIFFFVLSPDITKAILIEPAEGDDGATTSRPAPSELVGIAFMVQAGHIDVSVVKQRDLDALGIQQEEDDPSTLPQWTTISSGKDVVMESEEESISIERHILNAQESVFLIAHEKIILSSVLAETPLVCLTQNRIPSTLPIHSIGIYPQENRRLYLNGTFDFCQQGTLDETGQKMSFLCLGAEKIAFNLGPCDPLGRLFMLPPS